MHDSTTTYALQFHTLIKIAVLYSKYYNGQINRYSRKPSSASPIPSAFIPGQWSLGSHNDKTALRSIMVRVSARGAGGRGSIPDRVTPKR